MSEHEGVWVFSENQNLLHELLAAGSDLASDLKTKLTAVLLGNGLARKADELFRFGAQKVISVEDDRLVDFRVETYLNTLANLASERKPDVILIGSTKNGKELASRLAARLESGCTPDCTGLSINEEGSLVTTRVVYSGNAVVKATYCRKPQIATVPPRAFDKPEQVDRSGELEKVAVEVEASTTEVIEVNQTEVSDVKIEEAPIVVCGGRGVEKKEDFQPLKELAQLLGGQVSNTRPLAEDRKWFTGWVGLSGKKVKPTLYVGCGISGMIQHVAGMRDSQLVVAINRDPEAAIFEVADYVVVGDLYELVPAIVEALKKTL